MARNRNKKPGRKETPSIRGKRPAGGHLVMSAATMPFRWRVDQIDWGGSWGWQSVSSEVLLREIVPKLHDYETRTWAEIEGDRNHAIAVDDCIKAAQDRLVEIGIEEDSLFSLHLTGRQRVWGIKDVAVFRVVWWDPKHEICPSEKKHT